jgi:peptide deformylase
MAILKIARMGHPVLGAPAIDVHDPTSDNVKSLVEDMIETMADAGGIGLAAPQVHVPVRLVIFGVPADRLAAEVTAEATAETQHEGINAADGEDEANIVTGPIPLTVMINPLITPMSEDRDTGWESCLSVPGLAGLVPRFTHISVAYSDMGGDRQTIEAKGFHARVIQHECDHLDGVLYPQRMDDLSLFGFSEEIQKAASARKRAETETQAAQQAPPQSATGT